MATWLEGQYKVSITCRSFLLRMTNNSEKFVEKIKTNILILVTFFFESCLLDGKVEKYCRAVQATDDNMAHALCMLDN